MAKISVVRKSQLEGAMRLDAEYYMPKYTNAVDAVQNYGSFSELGRIAKVLRGRNPRAYSDNGIPIIRAIDLRDLTKTEDFLYANPAEELFFLKPKDILISSIGEGSIGKVQVFQDAAKCATVSEVSVVRSTDYNPYALATFLRSKYGYLQLERRITGSTGQLHLYPKDIVTVIVPLLPSSAQQTIEVINIEADHESRKSKVLYLQAEQLLLEELGFKDLDLSHQLYYTVPFKKTKEAGRLDAEHFQPKYKRLEERLLGYKGGANVLGSLIQPITNGYDYREFVSDGIPYLRVGDVRAGWLALFSAERISMHFIKKDIVLSVGDVLFTRKGTYGVASQVRLGEEGCIISSEIMRLRLLPRSQVLPDYLALFLNSVAARMQVEKYVHGFSNFSITQADIQKLIVPLPARPFQGRVAGLVTQSWEARQKARQLLEEAKSKVENLIEGKA